MSNVIQFRPRRRVAGWEHKCPFCGDGSSFVNVGAQQWGICDRHQVKWFIGVNATDDWLQQTQRDWIANRHYLEGLSLVYPEPPLHGEPA